MRRDRRHRETAVFLYSVGKRRCRRPVHAYFVASATHTFRNTASTRLAHTRLTPRTNSLTARSWGMASPVRSRTRSRAAPGIETPNPNWLWVCEYTPGARATFRIEKSETQRIAWHTSHLYRVLYVSNLGPISLNVDWLILTTIRTVI